MTFKNKRGDVPWYVVALLLALLVLVASLGAVYKIRQNQGKTGETVANACANVADGDCRPVPENGDNPCTSEERRVVGLCADVDSKPYVCCAKTS